MRGIQNTYCKQMLQSLLKIASVMTLTAISSIPTSRCFFRHARQHESLFLILIIHAMRLCSIHFHLPTRCQILLEMLLLAAFYW